MTFATCPDCRTQKVVVHAGKPHARIRSHSLPTDLTKTCPGSGKKA